MHTITYDDFSKIDLRSGTIVKALIFEKAKKPAYQIWVDFGPELGVLQTSAQVTNHYLPSNLIDMQVIGCVNLGEKNIAGFISQFLLVGFSDEHNFIRLATVSGNVPNGQKLH